MHSAKGSYSARTNALQPRSSLAIYHRQHFPSPVLGEARRDGKTVFESEFVRLWTTAEPGSDDVAILSFKSKANTLGPGVVEGIIECVGRAESDSSPLSSNLPSW